MDISKHISIMESLDSKQFMDAIENLRICVLEGK